VNVLIVDDEPLARMRLARLLEDHDSFTVVAEAENGEQAINACNQHNPDVVLMDIRMPLMDGLVAARHLAANEEPPAVIFCTAYNDYALEAFEANAVDYLLKPVNRDKLATALNKAQKLTRVQLAALGQTLPATDEKREHISARSTRGIELIALDEIRYFLADQKYVSVFYQRDGVLKEQLIDETIKELEQEFCSRFVRIHRNALAAVAHIQGLEKMEQGTYLKLADIEQGPQISRRHLADVRKLLQAL
jgi:two-component system response regulator AlgR